ncbi:MAG: nucleotidyltransferase domain-containing protein, partial [Nanoarchaeota archaeon]
KLSSKILEVEELRKKELFKNKNIKLIYKRIKEAKSPFYTLILFGSFANKTNTKRSDIDLCLITDNPEVTKEVQVVLSITPLDAHLVEFTSAQFISMLKSKGFNVGNEIVKNNVILYGIESFYEMINNVK